MRVGPGQEFEAALEYPVLQEAYALWLRLHDGDDIPGHAALDPLDMIGVLPSVNMVEVVPQPDETRRYRHRVVGTELVERFRAEQTGKWFDELYTPEHLAKQIEAYEVSAVEKLPTLGDISLKEDGHAILAYRRLIMPLLGEEDMVTRLFVVFAFKSLEQHHRDNEGLPLHQKGQGSWAD